jgi:hypothetical protein
VDEKTFAARLLDQIELMAEELEAKDKTIELLSTQLSFYKNLTLTYDYTRQTDK